MGEGLPPGWALGGPYLWAKAGAVQKVLTFGAG